MKNQSLRAVRACLSSLFSRMEASFNIKGLSDAIEPFVPLSGHVRLRRSGSSQQLQAVAILLVLTVN